MNPFGDVVHLGPGGFKPSALQRNISRQVETAQAFGSGEFEIVATLVAATADTAGQLFKGLTASEKIKVVEVLARNFTETLAHAVTCGARDLGVYGNNVTEGGGGRMRARISGIRYERWKGQLAAILAGVRGEMSVPEVLSALGRDLCARQRQTVRMTLCAGAAAGLWRRTRKGHYAAQ